MTCFFARKKAETGFRLHGKYNFTCGRMGLRLKDCDGSSPETHQTVLEKGGKGGFKDVRKSDITVMHVIPIWNLENLRF